MENYPGGGGLAFSQYSKGGGWGRAEWGAWLALKPTFVTTPASPHQSAERERERRRKKTLELTHPQLLGKKCQC